MKKQLFLQIFPLTFQGVGTNDQQHDCLQLYPNLLQAPPVIMTPLKMKAHVNVYQNLLPSNY
jgi:hypothetical protein